MKAAVSEKNGRGDGKARGRMGKGFLTPEVYGRRACCCRSVEDAEAIDDTSDNLNRGPGERAS